VRSTTMAMPWPPPMHTAREDRLSLRSVSRGKRRSASGALPPHASRGGTCHSRAGDHDHTGFTARERQATAPHAHPRSGVTVVSQGGRCCSHRSRVTADVNRGVIGQATLGHDPVRDSCRQTKRHRSHGDAVCARPDASELCTRLRKRRAVTAIAETR
jgi:hypothetical protein